MFSGAKKIMALLSLPGLLIVSALVNGEGFNDPTRPPDSMVFADDSSDIMLDISGDSGDGFVVSKEMNPNAVWNLSSILISPTRRLATINGQVFRVGDQFNNLMVSEISISQVKLQGLNEKIYTLDILPTKIKK